MLMHIQVKPKVGKMIIPLITRLRNKVLAVLFFVSAGCSPSEIPATAHDQLHVPKDFAVRFIRGGDPVRGTLLFTVYRLTPDGKVAIKNELVHEIRTEERQLTTEQLEILARRVKQVDLFLFSGKAEGLRDQCRKRETDQPRREVELTWEGRSAKIVDDFAPERCVDVVELKRFTDDLPQLLQGSLISTESKKASWPRNIEER